MTTKSLILISHVFPPDNAIGAVRVGKFAAGLARDHGWSVHAVVPRSSLAEPQTSAETGEVVITVQKTREIDMLRQVNSLRSIARRGKHNSPAPVAEKAQAVTASAETTPKQRGALARLSDLIAVPDKHSGWIYFAFREAARCIRRDRANSVLYSSGPPHSAHVAAAMAKRRTGRPWIADMRDPWTDNPYNPKLAPLAERWNKRLERRVLESADVILCTTEPARERLLALLPDFSPDRVVTVPNGYDPEDFADLRPQARWEKSQRPVLLHAGSVYGKRDPTSFLQALKTMHAESPETCPRAVFLGNWDDDILARAKAIVAESGDPQLVTMLSSVSRREALEIQAAADWLILLGDSMPEMLQIPGKLFEYLAMQRPILSLFPKGSPVEPYVANYANQYAMAPPNDVDAILAALRRVACASRESQAPRPVTELERSHQIAQVNELLEGLLGQRDCNHAALRESEAAAVVG